MAKITALNKETHRDITVSKAANYPHTHDHNIIPVAVHEFAQAAAEFPIIFVKNAETNDYEAAIMTGLTRGENLYAAGPEWPGIYVPACIRDYPLRLVKVDPEADNFVLAIDEESDLVGEGRDIRLFDAEGEQTDFTRRAGENLVSYLENQHFTRGFLKLLVDADLLVQRQLEFKIGSEPMKISGIYLIDQEKFNQLPEETFSDFRKRGLLAPIYAHLISLNQMPRLLRMRVASRQQPES